MTTQHEPTRPTFDPTGYLSGFGYARKEIDRLRENQVRELAIAEIVRDAAVHCSLMAADPECLVWGASWAEGAAAGYYAALGVDIDAPLEVA